MSGLFTKAADLPPLSVLFIVLGKESLCAAHTQGVGSAEYLDKLFEIRLCGRFLSSPPFTHVFTSLKTERLAQDWENGRCLIHFIGSGFLSNHCKSLSTWT